MSWLVGGETLVAEVQIPVDAAVPDDWKRYAALGHDKVGTIIRDGTLSAAGQALAETCWKQIPTAHRSKRTTIERLEQLASDIRRK